MASKSTKSVRDVFKEVGDELGGLKALSLVELETGLTIDSFLVDEKFDMDAAAAYNAEVVKAKIKAKNAMGLGNEHIEAMIIELNTQIHIIQPTPDEKMIIYLAADSKKTNLGMARKAAKTASLDIQNNLN